MFFFTVLFSKVYSTHYVGGELYYDHLGGSQYRITLKLYRDCTTDLGFYGQGNGEAILDVKGIDQELVYQFILGIPVINRVLANSNNPCMKSPSGVCVEEGVYTKTVTLPPKTGGYILQFRTCCRSANNLNLLNPTSEGNGYKCYIPGPETAASNSSPRFVFYPSLYVCKGANINFNHSAIDPDGDSLVYSLIPAYDQTLDQADSIVQYKAPYSASYPMASNPPININSSNGTVNGVPTILGQWLVCIAVKEYRNGKLLSTHYRDFQYIVISCVLNIKVAFADQLNKCDGYTINFQNQSTSNFNLAYLWNFGDKNTTTDTSSIKNPSYTYQDTGKHVVTLVVNPGLPCADSIKKTFYVYPKFDPQFNIPASPVCLKNTSLAFNITGTYTSQAVFNSNFGSAATPSVSSLTSNTVVYNSAGKFPIKLYGKQFICKDSLIDSIRVIGPPIAKINNFPETFCDPATVAFSNGSYSEYSPNYKWQISNGSTYFTYEPTHVFTPAGSYSVMLTVTRGGICPDTSMSPAYHLTVNPSPHAGFIVTPSVTSIFDPEISVESYASDVTTLLYDFGNGFYSNYMNDRHKYTEPGTYKIIQTITNRFQCQDIQTQEVIILPEFRFWVPNAFTPGEDGLNDVFKPLAIGLSDYKMEIFSRNGERLFSTTDLDKGWDGTLKGNPCKQDVYVWRATFKNTVSKKFEEQTGHVTLFNQQ